MKPQNICLDILKGYMLEDCDYVNIVRYVNVKYNVSVSEFANLFECSRPTLYKYLSYSTYQLPLHFLIRFARIYEVSTFDEVILIEGRIQALEQSIPSILETLSEQGRTVYIPKDIRKQYEIIQDETNVSVYVKERLSLEKKWKLAIEALNDNNGYTQGIAKDFASILRLNTQSFNRSLISQLARFKENDQHLIDLLIGYWNDRGDTGIYGTFHRDKHKIQDQISNIMKQKRNSMSINPNAFSIEPSWYLGFRVRRVEEFNPHFQKYPLEQCKVVAINITAHWSLTVRDSTRIIDQIKHFFGEMVEIAWGISSTESSVIQIDIFGIVEKQ